MSMPTACCARPHRRCPSLPRLTVLCLASFAMMLGALLSLVRDASGHPGHVAAAPSPPALSRPAPTGEPRRPRAGEPSLDEVRRLTERFRDVSVALAEGYIRDPSDTCESAEHMGRPADHGAMGVHYFRPDLLGITAPPSPRVDGVGTHTDFRRPAILIYEPQEDGTMALVAVENLVFEAAWRAAGNTAPPAFHGVSFDHMVDDPATALDEAHGFMPHFDLHVWLFRDNPNGMFAQFNPNVTCRHHRGGDGHRHATR